MDRVLLLRDRLKAVPPPATDVPVDAYLGIDIGSVSTNLVVIDAAGQVLKEIYLRTDARPVEAVGRGLRDIEETLGDRIRICGVGTTGSGRELIAELVGADTTKDEITAHKTGAAFIDQGLLGLGVDTIFEIGGQDAKFISLRGRDRRGLHDERGLRRRHRQLPRGARAGAGDPDRRASSRRWRSRAAAPIRLGERCTVFMERDVNDCLRRGAALEDIVAGLAYSVATNYINRVVRGRRIGETIFLQGGTAYNDAVAAALSAIVGKRIIVPPFNGVMGALGVALLAARRCSGAAHASLFRGFAPHEVDCETFEFTCRGLHQLLPDAARHGGGQAHLLGRQVLGPVPQGRPRRARARDRGPRRVPAVEAARRLRARSRARDPSSGCPSACRRTTGRRSGSRCSGSWTCGSCSRSRPGTTS